MGYDGTEVFHTERYCVFRCLMTKCRRQENVRYFSDRSKYFYFGTRLFDIMDLILNTLGGITGFLLYRTILKRSLGVRFLCSGTKRVRCSSGLFIYFLQQPTLTGQSVLHLLRAFTQALRKSAYHKTTSCT